MAEAKAEQERFILEKEKEASAKLKKAELKREESSGGIVDRVITAITSNLKKQNKDADHNNTVRAKINTEATATDDAMNVTKSALHGALHEWGK